MKCPICNEEMSYYKTAWFCERGEIMELRGFKHQVVVLCNCGRRMIPEAHWSDENNIQFWKCPHCFRRV